MTRKAISLHFLLCLMIPPICVLPSLDGYLPITAPKGPLIFHTLTDSPTIKASKATKFRHRERESVCSRVEGSLGSVKCERVIEERVLDLEYFFIIIFPV